MWGERERKRREGANSANSAPTHTHLQHSLLQSINVVVDTSHDKATRVAVVSGGGSGHEPHAAGYVGPGLLTAAVCGQLFASPSTAAVTAALDAVASPAHGAVLIVLNYTGDRLNFGAAAAAAVAGGTPVEVVYVSDDVALLPPPSCGADAVAAATRRARGLAACAFVFKVAGAAAAAGLPVAAVAAAARGAADAAATTGVAATACALPFKEAPARVPAGSLEFGLGLHGEPGAAVVPAEGGAGAVVEKMLASIEAARHARPGWPAPGSRAPAALLVNNLGACSALEVCAILAAALAALDGGSDWSVVRVAAGPLATSLDMRGVSLTLLPLTHELMGWLDAPGAAPGWPSTGAAVRAPGGPTRVKGAPPAAATPTAAGAAPDAATGDAATLAACIRAAAAAVTAKAGDLDALDAAAGDGDCGETLAAGAAAAVAALDGGRLPLASPADTLAVLGRDVLGKMGGTSGAIYAILFSAAAPALRTGTTPSDWAAAIAAGAAAVSSHGGAQTGDRTLLDALLPAAAAAAAAVAVGADARDVAAAAARAAAEGAAATASMTAGAGRAASVRADAVAGVADAGAVAVGEWLASVAEVLWGGES